MGKVTRPSVAAPTLLADGHRLDAFRCVEPSLENWLKHRARKNHAEGASRTFVVCAGDDVIAYYCLSAGSVARDSAPGNLRRNMPDPVPVAVLGRLAVHADWANQGIGRGLLKDAILRTAGLAREIGIRALLCHAMSLQAKAFYLKHGFAESPLHPMTVLLPIAQ